MSKDASAQAKDKAQQSKNTLLSRLEDDGVANPTGLALIGLGGAFLAMVPVTSWLAQSGGLVEKAVNGVAAAVMYVGTAGATSTVAQSGKLAALTTLYVTVTFALSGAGSAAGRAASSKEGLDNNHPRAQVASLRGLPLRLHSAHYNLLEMFPSFAITAALAQTIAPRDQVLLNLLGLHVISKVFVYYPMYLLNIAPPRTLAHFIATASVINVGLRLAKTPLV